ncbi:MAG TPA: tautomerase family protein [Ktedonobacteraceae bacterium]|nr:tautomerase family protein [Ktedonobacteraceae bacterium]
MPIIDITYPANTFSQEQQRELTTRLSPLIAKWERQPENRVVLDNTWVILREQSEGHFTVGGRVQTGKELSRYLVRIHAPEGSIAAEDKQGLADDITSIILDLEGETSKEGAFLRVWCIFQDVPDGNWGYGGRVLTRSQISARTRGAAS